MHSCDSQTDTRPGRVRLTTSDGSAVIIAMMFILVMLGLGVALFTLIKFSINGTELERKEVKAFNVAEAGIDAGMLALKLEWPDQIATTVDAVALRNHFDANVFRDPSRSSPSEFIQVALYDNNGTTDYSDANPAVDLDSESASGPGDPRGDDMMWVDSRANVDDDRHRILVLAKRERWNLNLPNKALFASTLMANPNVRVAVDSASTPPSQTDLAVYSAPDPRDVELLDGVTQYAGAPDWSQWITSGTTGKLQSVAKASGTYFDDDPGTPYPSIAEGVDLLVNGDPSGKIIYLKSSTAIEIAGNTQIATREHPVVLVMDTPSTVTNALDFRGTADFYGVVISLSNLQARGTSSFYGSVLCAGQFDNRGRGVSPEINYNGDIIAMLSRKFTMSVSIVPNTWQEYTVPNTTLAVAGG